MRVSLLIRAILSTSKKSIPAGNFVGCARFFVDDSTGPHRDMVGPAKYLDGYDARVG
jgi:hypothetical protein